MDQYYYIENGNQNGPFTSEELKTKALNKDTQVWKAGMSAWIPAEELPELNDIFSSTPPALPKLPPFILPDNTEGNKEQGEKKEENKEYHDTKNSKKNWLLPGILFFLIIIDIIWIIAIIHLPISEKPLKVANPILAVLIIFFVIFLRRERKKPGIYSKKKNGVDSISIRDPDDIEMYIQQIKKGGNKVDVNGILDEGGALLVQEKNGKQWRIDFRPFGKGAWMPHIQPGDEVKIIGRWRERKQYVLVNSIYNKTTHKKGEKGFF